MFFFGDICFLFYLLLSKKKFFYRDGYENLGDGEGDDLNKPLTRAELQNRVMDGVKRKEQEASKDGFQFEQLAAQKSKGKKN